MIVEVFRTLKPYFIVFAASACTLIIEIVAGRILAPTIGVSLYTWTSIIGIVLAGISLGNYLGGRIADKYPSPVTLGLILLAGGVASIGILPVDQFLSDRFLALPIIPRIVMLTAVLFLLPAVILGMVSPVVIKLRLSDLSETGNVVGKIYAVSTAGSILGTFLTGFVLVQLLGTRMVILIVALIFIAMAVVFGNLWRVRYATAVLGVLFVAILATSVFGGGLDSGCIRESNYFCIKVRAQEIGDREVRVLYLDALLHSYVDINDPLFLHYPHEKVFGDIATTIAHDKRDMDSLFIGGGGYTMPRFLEVMYPNSSVEVVEIDPEVVAANVPILPPEVYSANQLEGRGTAVTQFMPSEEFVRWLGDDRKVIITDDFVPVDGMLAPLYLESR